MYEEIGDSLPLFKQYIALFEDKSLPHMHRILEMVFLDILEFHDKAYRYFKRPSKAYSLPYFGFS
jgi:hypothetical protein